MHFDQDLFATISNRENKHIIDFELLACRLPLVLLSLIELSVLDLQKNRIILKRKYFSVFYIKNYVHKPCDIL